MSDSFAPKTPADGPKSWGEKKELFFLLHLLKWKSANVHIKLLWYDMFGTIINLGRICSLQKR